LPIVLKKSLKEHVRGWTIARLSGRSRAGPRAGATRAFITAATTKRTWHWAVVGIDVVGVDVVLCLSEFTIGCRPPGLLDDTGAAPP